MGRAQSRSKNSGVCFSVWGGGQQCSDKETDQRGGGGFRGGLDRGIDSIE